MFFGAEWDKFLWEGIIFITFIIVCGGLVRLRFSRAVSLLAAGGTVAAVLLLQAVLLLSGQDATLVLTLMPLTAYVPAIICLHILSDSGFFRTVAVWTVGMVVHFVLKMIWKILVQRLGALSGMTALALDGAVTGCLLVSAGIILYMTFRFLRGPFQMYVLQNHTNWLLISFPVLMVFLLFSYISDSTTDETLILLLLLTACAVFLVTIRVLTSAWAIARLEESVQAVSAQMETQRQEYEDVRKKWRWAGLTGTICGITFRCWRIWPGRGIPKTWSAILKSSMDSLTIRKRNFIAPTLR